MEFSQSQRSKPAEASQTNLYSNPQTHASKYNKAHVAFKAFETALSQYAGKPRTASPESDANECRPKFLIYKVEISSSPDRIPDVSSRDKGSFWRTPT